jgi:polar amino acid transport system substrate-binding protein
MRRRKYLKSIGAGAAIAGLAGCSGGGGGSDTETATEGGDTATEDEADTMTSTETETATESSGDNPYGVENGVLTIGSDIPYAPFEFRNEEGDLMGFDVEIAEAVFAGQLGLDYEFQKTSFDTIIPSLNNGNFRVIMSAMTINDERDEQVDFSDPYFTAYQTVILPESSDISSREDLRGVTAGVQKGTTGEGAAEGLKEEFDGELEIQSYDQITGAFDALLNGQVDVVINDNTVNAEFVSEQDSVRFLEGEGAAAAEGENAPPYLTLTVENYGIAFREDDDELLQAVNEALAAIRESGEYDEIYSEYFAG